MEFNFAPRRVLLFLGLLGLFALVGGMSPPQIDTDLGFAVQRFDRGWIRCMGLYATGAVLVCFVDHMLGLFDRANLRPVYAFIGIVLMVAGWLGERAIVSGARPPERTTAVRPAK